MTARMKTLPKVDLSDQPDDESSELPEGWCRTSLDTIGTIYCGQSPATGDVNSNGEGTPYVTGPEQWDGQSIRANKWTTDPRRVVPDGCIFITVKGAGVGTLFPGDACAIGRDVYAFHPTPPISREFTQYALQRTIDLVVRQASGLIPGLTRDHLLEHGIAVPPLAEQRRIVAKLEELLGRVSRAKARLDRIPALLKRFRQSVLAAACSGKLTADWREKNPIAPRDNLSVDLEKVPFEIPHSWEWKTFASVSREITVGYVGPMAKEYINEGVPFLRSQNVRSFRFDPANLKFISRDFHKKISKSSLTPGDVAVVRSGNAGTACVIPESLGEANCSDLVILRPSNDILSRFACIFLNSTEAQSHIDSVKVGIAQGHFNVGSMKQTLVPIPPLLEQLEIVRRVEHLFAFADQIEARLTKAQAQVDRLTQSILAKAFRGELVPTEAELARSEGRDYEPASKLLERIRTANTSFASANSTSKPKRKMKSRGE